MPEFHWITRLTAVGLCVLAYIIAYPVGLTDIEREELASSYKFQTVPLIEHTPFGQLRRSTNKHLSRLDTWVSSVGSSVALGDLDGDGYSDDLCLVDPRTDAVTVMPVPGTGTYGAVDLSMPGYWYAEAMAPFNCKIGDFNEDGVSDLMVGFAGRPPALYLQVAPMAFEVQEIIENVMTLHWVTPSMVIADLNGDSHYDLVLGNYFASEATTFYRDSNVRDPQMPNSFSTSLNGGENQFLLLKKIDRENFEVDYTIEQTNLGEQDLRGWTLAAGVADFNQDMLPDIYFGNDFGPDRLLINRYKKGKLHFQRVEGRDDFYDPHSFVLGKDSYKGMGIDFKDLNQDGQLDFVVSNVSQFEFTESHYIFVSKPHKKSTWDEGYAPYSNKGMQLGFYDTGWGWGLRAADFNNNGQYEILQTTGFIKGTKDQWPEFQELAFGSHLLMHMAEFWPRINLEDDISGHQRNPFLVLKDGKYHDVSRELGMGQERMSRGIALGDVDGDGDMDFIMAHQYEGFHYFKNEAPDPGAFIGVRVYQYLDDIKKVSSLHKGLLDNRAGKFRVPFGTRAYLVRGKKRIASEVDGGSGHTSQSAPELHFGLGKIKSGEKFSLELVYRNRSGEIASAKFPVEPGWNTVLLGEKGENSAREGSI